MNEDMIDPEDRGNDLWTRRADTCSKAPQDEPRHVTEVRVEERVSGES